MQKKLYSQINVQIFYNSNFYIQTESNKQKTKNLQLLIFN